MPVMWVSDLTLTPRCKSLKSQLCCEKKGINIKRALAVNSFIHHLPLSSLRRTNDCRNQIRPSVSVCTCLPLISADSEEIQHVVLPCAENHLAFLCSWSTERTWARWRAPHTSTAWRRRTTWPWRTPARLIRLSARWVSLSGQKSVFFTMVTVLEISQNDGWSLRQREIFGLSSVCAFTSPNTRDTVSVPADTVTPGVHFRHLWHACWVLLQLPFQGHKKTLLTNITSSPAFWALRMGRTHKSEKMIQSVLWHKVLTWAERQVLEFQPWRHWQVQWRCGIMVKLRVLWFKAWSWMFVPVTLWWSVSRGDKRFIFSALRGATRNHSAVPQQSRFLQVVGWICMQKKC